MNDDQFAPKVMIAFRLPLRLADKLEQAALGHNTSAQQLAKRIVETVLNDDMLKAVLDE